MHVRILKELWLMCRYPSVCHICQCASLLKVTLAVVPASFCLSYMLISGFEHARPSFLKGLWLLCRSPVFHVCRLAFLLMCVRIERGLSCCAGLAVCHVRQLAFLYMRVLIFKGTLATVPVSFCLLSHMPTSVYVTCDPSF